MNESNPTSATAAVTGGMTIPVYFEDGSSKDVTVRQVKVKEQTQFFEAMDSEITLASLVTGLPVTEVENLTPSSLVAIVTVSDEVNADFFALFYRRLDQAKRINPNLGQPPKPAANSVLPGGRRVSPRPVG